GPDGHLIDIVTQKRGDVHRARIEARRVPEREARGSGHAFGERTIGAVRRYLVDDAGDIQCHVDVASLVDGYAVRRRARTVAVDLGGIARGVVGVHRDL